MTDVVGVELHLYINYKHNTASTKIPPSAKKKKLENLKTQSKQFYFALAVTNVAFAISSWNRLVLDKCVSIV